MKPKNSESSRPSVHKRLDGIENLLSEMIKGKNNLSGSPSSSTGESSDIGSRSKKESSRKRSASIDEDVGEKRKRREDKLFECTLCDRKYRKEKSLFKHYRESHEKKSPERVHRENLIKRAFVKRKSGNESENKFDCKLCEAAFNSTSARNNHYTGKHQIRDEKLLFLEDGTPLVESSFSYQISKNPKWFKTAVKRNMPSGVCKLCEVGLARDHLKFHYEKDHKVMQMSKIETLIRLNNIDIQQAAASEKCSYCSDAFADTKELDNHVASVHADFFKECKFCKKTIEMKLYNDHVEKEHKDAYFKKVDVSNEPTKVTEPNGSTTKKKDAEVADETEKQQEATVSASCASFRHSPTAQHELLMYMCDACNLVTSSYDNAIAHSQDHILNKVTRKPEVCKICELKFDSDFDVHKQMHLSNTDLDRDSFIFVSYDFKNLTTEKWLDMFNNAFTKSQVNKIISQSIYFSTRCVILKLTRDCKYASPQFTLFKCLTCSNYVDPKSLESHVGLRKACIDNDFGHQCIKCDKTFYTAEASDEHMKTHGVPDSNSRYREVLFNDPDDFSFNKALLENGGKSALFEKEVSAKLQPERDVIDKDVTAQTPANKVTVVTSETNKENPNVVSVVTDEDNKVDNEHKTTKKSKTKQGRVADVYKCSCGLCFHRFELLLIHMQKCFTGGTKTAQFNCPCGLVFDLENSMHHWKAHANDITTFKVKRVTFEDETQIDVSEKTEGFREELKIIIMEAMKAAEEVKTQNDDNVI